MPNLLPSRSAIPRKLRSPTRFRTQSPTTWNSWSAPFRARKEYENSLKALYEHYHRVGDKQRSLWIEKELMGFHLQWKPSYNLDVKDVPPPNLEAKVNVREANELYRAALEYKGKGFGEDYVLNQRRAEIYLREILEKYPNSDKIADVAYQLGDIYESRAFRQYDRAAKYFERSFQWVKGSRTDATLPRRGTLRQTPQRTCEGYRAVSRRDRPRHRLRPHQAGRTSTGRVDGE